MEDGKNGHGEEEVYFLLQGSSAQELACKTLQGNATFCRQMSYFLLTIDPFYVASILLISP
ncbi:hypothetical protein BM613_00860 [Sulfoacidibacillus thermotolerans]|uniref:Uncharacterized protein n=1 Tax=Sulfoacidibacillus thermotolerans TaxID=1765684 RepID=A0A2U3DBL5_SULT2|nr:hypothetical protein BM613_00860 [Sulfoacidibacillus thermotolerans]